MHSFMTRANPSDFLDSPVKRSYLLLIFIVSTLLHAELSFSSIASEPQLPITANCQVSLNRTQHKLAKSKAWSWQQNARGGKTPSGFKVDSLSSLALSANESKNPWKETRNKVIQIVVGEPGLNSLGNSPKLMESIATDVIQSCLDVVLVKFWLGYEWGPEVGLLGNGSVRVFECVNRQPRFRDDYPWGMDDCCC